jgi:hypothetical protein
MLSPSLLEPDLTSLSTQRLARIEKYHVKRVTNVNNNATTINGVSKGVVLTGPESDSLNIPLEKSD